MSDIFCPDCGGMLDKEKEDGEVVYQDCSSCEYEEDLDGGKSDVSDVVSTLEQKDSPDHFEGLEKSVEEIAEEEPNVMNGYDCPDCDMEDGYARRKEIPALWADEDAIEIYECLNCRSRQREGGVHL
ncbi:MAG: hypothetical protein MUP63_00305 [Candidatus Nanohaloarchaeota archaeon QJJ-7]|nr:hypothetical protein [Candidatus Nanohaloarchaeota archaeon QJJ-7]